MLRCSGGSVRAFDDTSRSPTWISPDVGSRKPAISRSVVVLPQPDGPSRQTSCPWSIRSETLSTTASEPNRLVRSRNSTDATRTPRTCLVMQLSARRISTKNAVAGRPRADSGGYTFGEPVDRGLGATLTMWDIERAEADLDHAERAQDHRRVDVAHMGDPERLALQLADADAKHHAAVLLA